MPTEKTADKRRPLMENSFTGFIKTIIPEVKGAAVLLAQPARAYGTLGSDAWFPTMIIPGLAYMFFALQIGVQKLSFIPTMTVLRVLILAFLGFIGGVAVSALISVILVFASEIFSRHEKRLDFTPVFTCVNISYGYACFFGVMFFLIQLISGWTTVLTAGVLSLLSATALSARICIVLTKQRDILMSAFVFAAGLVNVLCMSALFFSNL